MAAPRLVVLDSSVGVKWIKSESGSEEALSTLAEHREGASRIVVASMFVHEVLGVAVRHGGAVLGEQVWTHLEEAELTVIGLDDALARAAFEQCRQLGCSFYDALAPALAEQLGAILYTADRRAHGRVGGAVVLGQ